MLYAAAAEALKMWDGKRTSTGRSLGWGINPSPVLGVRGVTPESFFLKNIDANLCNLVHFGDIRSSKVGRKIDSFPSNF